MTTITLPNETVVRIADVKEFQDDLQYLVNLTAALDAANDALKERSKELQDKYAEHPSFNFKAAQLKKMAGILYKNNLEDERAKANLIFDTLEALEEE